MRLKLTLILLLWLVIMNSYAQKSGIQFKEFDNWEAVLNAAKNEGKPIFVDIYTTWCGPCKVMEKEVYPNTNVGEYFNNNFISIKVQMDQTRNDSEYTKKWQKPNDKIRSHSKQLEKLYDISGYPTFLFISSDGMLLNKHMGFLNPDDFITVAQKALLPGAKYDNPSLKYYSAITRYREGKETGANLEPLINELITSKVPYFGEKNNVIDSLNKYYMAYLKTLPLSSINNKNSLEIIGRIGVNSKDPLFKLFYPNHTNVDRVVDKKNFSRLVVDRAIANEHFIKDINECIKNKVKPNWDSLYKVVEKKYNSDYATRGVEAAKIPYYFFSAILPKQGKDSVANNIYDEAMIRVIEKYGYESILIYPFRTYPGAIRRQELETLAGVLTEGFCAEQLWIRSNNKSHIKSGVNIMKKVFDFFVKYEHENGNQGWVFEIGRTYANLLYKSGDTLQGIEVASLALELYKNSPIIDGIRTNALKEDVEKMKKGLPTW